MICDSSLIVVNNLHDHVLHINPSYNLDHLLLKDTFFDDIILDICQLCDTDIDDASNEAREHADEEHNEPAHELFPQDILKQNITRFTLYSRKRMGAYSQHCGYWCPGAKAQGHQYPQCWLNIHCIGPVSYKNITVMLDNVRK